jgi:hypothetical protein
MFHFHKQIFIDLMIINYYFNTTKYKMIIFIFLHNSKISQDLKKLSEMTNVLLLFLSRIKKWNSLGFL